jgi:hypothetical protein
MMNLNKSVSGESIEGKGKNNQPSSGSLSKFKVIKKAFLTKKLTS